jgi:hypothetical protein
MRGQDPSRKSHAVDSTEWFQVVLCGNGGLGVLKPAGKTPRCGRCLAIAARLKIRVKAT